MARLRTAWVHELTAWWEYYNRLFVGGRMRRPVVALSEAEHTLGSWTLDQRLIRISVQHIERAPWHDVLATLRHEMAHQYVDEILRVGDEAPHGPAFQRASQLLRADVPEESPADERGATSRIVTRVQKLLSLGTSSNEHEAAAAMRRAHALLLEHNLRLADLQGERSYHTRRLGTPKARHHAWEYTLSMLLNDFYFVEIIWAHSYDARSAKRGTLLEIYGSPDNLELAEYVHTYLTRLLPDLWSDYKARQGTTSNRERLRYFNGVLVGFEKKLREQATALREERDLVWIADRELVRYFRYHNPRVRTSSTSGSVESAAYRDGIDDGRNVSIRKPLAGESGIRGLLERRR